MKKFLAIILGALFVMSFAASAFAIHAEIPSETTATVAKGATQITLGGELRVRGWYKENIDANNAPAETNSQAFYDQRVRLSLDAMVTPNVEGFVQLESGFDKDTTKVLSSDLYTWGNFNQKVSGLNILQAWILYKGDGLFGFPAGLKIGHMPLALGEKQFFDHTKFGDDAIVFFMDPMKELHVGLLAIKFAEGSKTDNTDDLDGYVALATYKLDPKNTVGVNYTYLNNSDGRFTHQNLGVHANGNVSGLGYKAEADFQFGKLNANSKFKGYAFMGAVNYMVDPANLRASFAYGSGPDSGTDVKTFTTYLGADKHYTLVYDYQVNTTAGARFTGLSNTTYYNIGADFTPVKDVKASIDGYILRASKSVVAGGSKEAGWEVDGRVVYNVAKNLSYEVNAGYMKAGDFYGSANKGVTVLNNVLTLSF